VAGAAVADGTASATEVGCATATPTARAD
jgi:hypothetical protein